VKVGYIFNFVEWGAVFHTHREGNDAFFEIAQDVIGTGSSTKAV
jgi:hypothetical protein